MKLREQFLKQTDILCDILRKRPVKHEEDLKPAWEEWLRLLEEEKK